MPQSLVSLNCHIIFSTKNRAPFICDELQLRLFEYVGGILRNERCPLLAAGGISDHVHLLVSLGKEISISEAVRLVKANSSKWIHETWADAKDFAWQTGYAAFSVSCSNLEEVKIYLARQAEHHRVRSFREELLAFLDRHRMEYDERYLWD